MGGVTSRLPQVGNRLVTSVCFSGFGMESSRWNAGEHAFASFPLTSDGKVLLSDPHLADLVEEEMRMERNNVQPRVQEAPTMESLATDPKDHPEPS